MLRQLFHHGTIRRFRGYPFRRENRPWRGDGVTDSNTELRIPNYELSMMVVEWLQFRVHPGTIEKFLAKDAEIWTSAIAQYPGFLGKEVWIAPHAPEEIAIVVRWKTRQQWKAIPQTALNETERQFAIAMGPTYELIAVGEYEVICEVQTDE